MKKRSEIKFTKEHIMESGAGIAGKPSFRSAEFESRSVMFQRPYCDMLLLNRT